MLVEPILDRLRPVKVPGRGRPRRRPAKLHADKAYDNRRVRRCGITAGSPASASTPASGSADTAGSSNAPWLGYLFSAVLPALRPHRENRHRARHPGLRPDLPSPAALMSMPLTAPERTGL